MKMRMNQTIFLLFTLFILALAGCGEAQYIDKGYAVPIKEEEKPVDPFPYNANDVTGYNNLPVKELGKVERRQYAAPLIYGNFFMTTEADFSKILTDLIEKRPEELYLTLNETYRKNHPITDGANNINAFKAHIKNYVNLLIDDYMNYCRLYPNKIIYINQTKTVCHNEECPACGKNHINVCNNITIQIPVQQPDPASDLWNLADNNALRELFTDKYYYQDPKTGDLVAAEVVNKDADVYRSSNPLPDYNNFLLNCHKIKLTYWVPSYVKKEEVPKESEMLHDLGYIAPVAVKTDNCYVLWCTRLMKHFMRDEATNYRKYYYQFELCAFTSEDGENWKEAESYYLDKLNEIEAKEEKGGRIITDVKYADNGWNLYYLARENTSDSLESGWQLYGAYSTHNSRPIDWRKMQGKKLINVIKCGLSGFDNQGINRASILVNDTGDVKRLYYAGYNGKQEEIGIAQSDAAFVNWLKGFGGNALIKVREKSFDGKSVTDPAVIYSEGIFKMYYAGFDGNNWRLGLTYSRDGVRFRYYNDEHTPLVFNIMNDVRYPYILQEYNKQGEEISKRLFYCERVKVYTEEMGGKKILYDDKNDYTNFQIKSMLLGPKE